MEDMESQIEQLRANRGRNRVEANYEDDDSSFLRGEDNPPKEDGVMGVMLIQCIIAVIIAIIYVLIMTLNKSLAYEVKVTILDKSANDFSFKDKVYETVGEAISYLNELQPIDMEVVEDDMTSSVVEDEISQKSTSDGATDAVTSDIAQESTSSLATQSQEGAGGEPNPVEANMMPTNATYAPVIFTGRISFPIEDAYHITSQFGFRDHPSEGFHEFHTAVDIGAVKGTPIIAAADGVVIKSEQGNALGNYIIIDHSNGFQTIYGHCDTLIAKEGARIREGEVIAKVGSTGDSTGNHLHFGMKKDELYFDPSYIFKDEIDVTV